jgi:hypothetical protein
MKNSEYRPYKESGFNLIIKVGECTDKDIEDFRESLPEFGKQVFDRIEDQGKKMSVVTLGRMSKEELEDQEKYLRQCGGNYMVGLHDYRNVLMILDQCRTDIEEVLAKAEKLIKEGKK